MNQYSHVQYANLAARRMGSRLIDRPQAIQLKAQNLFRFFEPKLPTQRLEGNTAVQIKFNG